MSPAARMRRYPKLTRTPSALIVRNSLRTLELIVSCHRRPFLPQFRPLSTSIRAFPRAPFPSVVCISWKSFVPGAFRSPQRASLSLFCAVTLHGPPSIFPHFTTLTTNNTPPPVERKKEKFFPPPTSLSFTILATDWSLLRSQAVAWDPLFFPRRCSGAALRVKKHPPGTRQER